MSYVCHRRRRSYYQCEVQDVLPVCHLSVVLSPNLIYYVPYRGEGTVAAVLSQVFQEHARLRVQLFQRCP